MTDKKIQDEVEIQGEITIIDLNDEIMYQSIKMIGNDVVVDDKNRIGG